MSLKNSKLWEGFDWDDLDFEMDFIIDKRNLEMELVVLPETQKKYSMGLALLRNEKKELHEQVKVLRSELSQECKENNSKATAPQVEAYYRTNEGFKELNLQLKTKEVQIETMQQYIWDLSAKRKSLDLLVKLYGCNYWNEMDAPRPIGRQMEEKRERFNESYREHQKNKKEPEPEQEEVEEAPVENQIEHDIATLECPLEGVEFGNDFDEYNECDTCAIKDKCERAKDYSN